MTNLDSEPLVGVPVRPWRRSARRAEVGGVCSGLARRLGVTERVVRFIWSASILVAGAGLVVYVLAWIFLPRSGEMDSIAQRLRVHRRESKTVAAVSVTLTVILSLSPKASAGVKEVIWCCLISALGVGVALRHASTAERVRLADLSDHLPFLSAKRGWPALFGRVVPGVALVVIGLQLLAHVQGLWAGTVPVLIGTGVALVGGAVILAPWWLTTVRDLTDERRERIRAEERAVLAAQVHDSVLQTLTVIERAAADRPDILSLVREESRELRDWLFHPHQEEDGTSSTLSRLLRELQDSMESEYGCRIDVVTVGDLPSNPSVVALAQATRELTLNAARWSGASVIHIFSEVEESSVTVCVRDDGRGFDVTADVGDGLRHSVIHRVERLGGTVTMTSAPGEGTDVCLSVPR